MWHTMRAEYERQGDEGEPPGRVVTWHMVRGEGEENVAMCGKTLWPAAKTLPETEWGRTAEPICHTCGALYLREVA